MAGERAQHDRLWDIALRGTAGSPQLMLVVMLLLKVVLLITTAQALVLMSFVNRQIGRRFPVLSFVYGFALAATLWMTLDLDHPS
ncbi:hypothetical protein [Reyranella sp.]|uniref:hypothetical protein n=1 Tax=Reyranella sp. TaxID=1929291 RepID=UPI00120C141C|nr:hypothetical protein [Reyranella sp.]TAJ91046.1 MAG: hypothetical protein EPO50_00520 [Reyranella sp.]